MRGIAHDLILASVAAVCLALTLGHAHAADEDATKSLMLVLDGACDPKNSRLYVENKHATRAIVATLRWNLAGSKRIASDVFQVAPNSRLEVGCAAQADIVSAEFAP